MNVEAMGTTETTTETVETVESGTANRQEAALERLRNGADWLFKAKVLTYSEQGYLYAVALRFREGMASKNGLTEREAVFLRGIFTLLTVIKRLLLRVPKRNLKN